MVILSGHALAAHQGQMKTEYFHSSKEESQ
jgi:hypothetical protein